MADDIKKPKMTSSESLNVLSVNTTKAGMEGLDTEMINKIIMETSKGSKFYEAKAKNQSRIDRQVEEMSRKLSSVSQESLASASRQADAIIENLKADRDLSRIIVHVDMDAFYAAVEERDDPSLKGKPMAVGSLGMLSTSNYQARKFGVRAAMPGFIAKKLCPNLVIVPLNFDKYRAVSSVVREVFREYDPEFCPMSLDEAYLDITNYIAVQKSFGNLDITPGQVVEEMRKKIFDRTRLTASAGIAPNTFLAKVCSDQNKPNGQFELSCEVTEIENFVANLPIRKVSGIGNVTEQLLKRVLNVETCAHIFENRAKILLLFSEISSGFFLQRSLGIGATNVSEMQSRERKSLSTEATFRDTDDKEELFSILDNLSTELANDLDQNELKGSQLTLKIKTHRFRIKTRVTSLIESTSDVAVLKKSARKLLQWFIDSSEEKPLRLRLLGVRMSGFKGRDDHPGEKVKLQSTIDSFLSTSSSGFSPSSPASSMSTSIPQNEISSHRSCNNDIKIPPHRKSGLGGNSEEMRVRFQCPVCNEEIFALSEDHFNRTHLDACLIQGTNNSTSSQVSPSEPRVRHACPVCELKVADVDLNRHIDECLNREMIRNLTQEEAKICESRKRKMAIRENSKTKKTKSSEFQSNRSILNYFASKGNS